MKSNDILLRELRRISIDNHKCFGCGHEHDCSIHGCAIIREAMDLIRCQASALTESEQARSELGQRLALAQNKLQDVEQASATVRRRLSALTAALDEALVKHE